MPTPGGLSPAGAQALPMPVIMRRCLRETGVRSARVAISRHVDPPAPDAAMQPRPNLPLSRRREVGPLPRKPDEKAARPQDDGNPARFAIAIGRQTHAAL